MAGFDDEVFGAPPAKPPVHAIGQPIDDLSAPELAERIALLKGEIERLERRPSRGGTPGRCGNTNGLLTIIIYE